MSGGIFFFGPLHVIPDACQDNPHPPPFSPFRTIDKLENPLNQPDHRFMQACKSQVSAPALALDTDIKDDFMNSIIIPIHRIHVARLVGILYPLNNTR